MLTQVAHAHFGGAAPVQRGAAAPGIQRLDLVFAQRFQAPHQAAPLQQGVPVFHLVVGIEQLVLQLGQAHRQYLAHAQEAVDHGVEHQVRHAQRARRRLGLHAFQLLLDHQEAEVVLGAHRDQQALEDEERGGARFQRKRIVLRPQALEDQHVVIFGAVEVRAVIGVHRVGHLSVVDLDAEQQLGPVLPALGLAAHEVEPDVAFLRHVLQPVVHDRRLAVEAVVDFHRIPALTALLPARHYLDPLTGSTCFMWVKKSRSASSSLARTSSALPTP